MLDYAKAQTLSIGRLNKHLGRRIATNVWMKYDSERGCYVCSDVWTKYKVDDKASAELGYVIYKAVGRDEWDMRPYAEIYPDRIVITRQVSNQRLSTDFHIRSYRTSSNATDGLQWYHSRKSGGVRVVGSLPVTLDLTTGELTATAPRVRTFNKEKQKELNSLIARIRRELKVRYKLGAFNSLTMPQLSSSLATALGADVTRYKVMSNPVLMYQVLCMVTPDDIESFYPLICLLHRCQGGYSTDQHPNLPKLFERLISSRKEVIRLETGVVYYEAADNI